MTEKLLRHAPLFTGLIGIAATAYGFILTKSFPHHVNLVWLLIGFLNLVGGILIGLQYRRLYLLSTKDSLTGLNNRRLMDRRFANLLKKAVKQGTEITLLLIDIDNFKTINDTNGHAAGDRVLQQVSEILHRCVRCQDLLFRWGGEEFAVLISAVPLATALEIAERTRQQVEQHDFSCAGAPFRVTVSIGVYSSLPNHDFHQIFQAADQALYQAKKSRNAVSLWQPSL